MDTTRRYKRIGDDATRCTCTVHQAAHRRSASRRPGTGSLSGSVVRSGALAAGARLICFHSGLFPPCSPPDGSDRGPRTDARMRLCIARNRVKDAHMTCIAWPRSTRAIESPSLVSLVSALHGCTGPLLLLLASRQLPIEILVRSRDRDVSLLPYSISPLATSCCCCYR